MFFQYVGNTGQRAASAHTRDKDINVAVSIFENFLCGGVAVNFRVGRIIKLLQHDRTINLGHQFFSTGNRTFHALGRRGQVNLCPQKHQHLAPFNRHAFRHGQNKVVALGRSNESQRNTGIARSRLNQGGTRFDLARLLGGFDHCQTDTILDRCQRIEEFKLADQIRFYAFCFCQTRKANQRRCTDGVDNAVVNLTAKLSHVFLALFCILPSCTYSICI